ncbi:MAG: ABC transporter substrate-binding protein [Candidatus Leucobacter sulfamidivorax]|nr:ABC transporter substrate-binding protein [Candidatus Leucobacter sulfamidivorax]
MKIRFALPALAAVAALALAGCTNTDGAEGGANSIGPSGLVETVEVDDAAAALVPADIADAGKLVMGSDGDYFPNEFKAEDGTTLTGWGIELAEAVAAKLGLEPEWEVLDFDSIIPRIEEGVVNVGASSFTDNLKRQETVDFVNYYNAGTLWAAKAGANIDPDNACGLKVAVQQGTVQERTELPARSKKCVDDGEKAIEILPFDGQAAATNAVVNDQADAFSADSPVTLGAVVELGGVLEPQGAVFASEPYGFAVQKGSPLAQAVQAALQSLMDDGTYLEILEHWSAESGAITEATINAGTSPGDEE